MVRKAHEIDGIAIYETDDVLDGFFIKPIDAKRVDRETLASIDDWCRRRTRAYYVADRFVDLEYAFDPTVMERHDLDLLLEVFADSEIGEMARREKQRLMAIEWCEQMWTLSSEQTSGQISEQTIA